MRTLILTILIVCSISGLAQEKPKAPVTGGENTIEFKDLPKIENKNIPLKLTDAELRERETMNVEFRDVSGALEAALFKTRLVIDKDKALALFWEIKAVASTYQDLRARWANWIVTAQKAHGCDSCDIVGDSFVRPNAGTPGQK